MSQQDLIAFGLLRGRVHEQMEERLDERLRVNHLPTQEEIRIGAFAEELEPQVRDTVFEMYRKGYTAISSGFYAEGYQAIAGFFDIDEETVDKLKTFDVEYIKLVFEGNLWRILRFKALGMTLDQMKAKWDEIVGVLPDKGRPGHYSTSRGAVQFRSTYAGDINYEEEWNRAMREIELLNNQT